MNGNENNRQRVCPISYALGIFGDRWSLLILRDLMLGGRRRYKELLASPEGIATNVLADRLKRLEAHGLITKTRDPDDRRQYVYRPTESAIALVPMLLEILVWGTEHSNAPADRTLVQRYREDRERLIEEVRSRLRKGAE